MVKKTPDQGDVVWLSLNPVKGHEQKWVVVLTKKNIIKQQAVF